MNIRHASRWFWLALALVCLTIPFLANEAATHPQGGAANANLKTAGGLTVVTFTVNPGTIKVYLPDDMRAGDTISGTVIAEPNGQTEEERARNRDALAGFKIDLVGGGRGGETKPQPPILTFNISTAVTASNSNFTFTLPSPAQKTGASGSSTPSTGGNAKLEAFLRTIDDTTPPILPPVEIVVFSDHNSPFQFSPDERVMTTPPPSGATSSPQTTITVPTTSSGAVITPDPKTTPTFVIPPLGQTGRPMVVTGPFDGDSSNTNLDFDPGLKPESVSEFTVGLEYELRAESPRKAVFEAPSNVTGPIEIKLKEGNVETKGTYRNVGVNLSAPKTNLVKGEKTTLTVQVSGLEGIKEDVPLQLDSKGVITMVGGNFQNLRIKPSEVKQDGRYTTTRAITGQQAGGFTVTATVIVNRFDFCLQDDTDLDRLFFFNSFTGDYVFHQRDRRVGYSIVPGRSVIVRGEFTDDSPPVRPGGTPQPGGTVQPGGTTQPGGTVQPGGTTPPGGTDTPPITPTGTTLTGIGKPVMKGCIITLSHNAPDRRVFARLDACTKTGDASVQTNSPKADIKITDKNTTDNTAGSPPPK